jgi:hypothetical protein
MNDRLNSLEDQRNDALHAPYSVLLEDFELRVVPYTFGGNVRAKKLRGKNLAGELRTYSSHMNSLKEFARQLLGKSRLQATDLAWPERPGLQRPSQATAQKSRSRQTEPR